MLGLWTDVLLYRRDAFAILGALYRFVVDHAGDTSRRVRVLPGPVRTELLLLAALAPLLDTNLRATVSPTLLVTDSSLRGACAVAVDVPDLVARELWRQRLGPGRYAGLDKAAGLCRGDSYVGDILEGCPARELLKFRYRGTVLTINMGEARARRALWRLVAADPEQHARRHLVVYDSRVVLAAAARGRADGRRLLREFRLAYPHLLASDCVEGGLWTDSERNSADSGSRGGPPPVPGPRRRWVHDLFSGDLGALDDRLRGPSRAVESESDDLPEWWKAWADRLSEARIRGDF